jgi:hypothetical protein
MKFIQQSPERLKLLYKKCFTHNIKKMQQIKPKLPGVSSFNQGRQGHSPQFWGLGGVNLKVKGGQILN